VKAAFDPRNQFNPGKVAAPAGGALLRIDNVPTKGSYDRKIPAAVREGYDEALHCNGNGACFSWDSDEAMCPSWKGTRERRHSPKGRAQLMREWLRRLATEGVNPLEEAQKMRRLPPWRNFPARVMATLRRDPTDFSHQVYEAMSGCLACKSCSGQCPVKVDVPTFRAKFLELYHGRYLRPLRHHALGALESLMPLMALFPRLFNAVTGSGLLRLIGLVHTPKLSSLRLGRELRQRGVAVATPAALSALTPNERAASVVVVPDAFTRYYEPEVLLALLELLKLIGIQPWIAPFRPNGKPLHVHGFLAKFARIAALNSQNLGALVATGVELIGIDPSMTLTYRSEYPAALPGQVMPKVALIQEWLEEHSDILPRLEKARQFRFIPHCTERSTAHAAVVAWQRVFNICGLDLKVEAAGCCGMAGTFGHEAEHRALAERIYGQSWSAHVAKRESAPLLADGFSCRAQAASIDGVKLLHPVQALLAEMGRSSSTF
jgi:Fe-S oxidoreductase